MLARYLMFYSDIEISWLEVLFELFDSFAYLFSSQECVGV
jgi:hypothetical protein